eukprot:2217199-Pyramimonas_sp.AAC.1
MCIRDRPKKADQDDIGNTSVGMRTVHLPPTLGKGWHCINSTAPDMPSQVYGFLPGKRKESAIGGAMIGIWRAKERGIFALAHMHDLSNAFGSVHWGALQEATDAVTREGLSPQGCQRYQGA